MKALRKKLFLVLSVLGFTSQVHAGSIRLDNKTPWKIKLGLEFHTLGEICSKEFLYVEPYMGNPGKGNSLVRDVGSCLPKRMDFSGYLKENNENILLFSSAENFQKSEGFNIPSSTKVITIVGDLNYDDEDKLEEGGSYWVKAFADGKEIFSYGKKIVNYIEFGLHNKSPYNTDVAVDFSGCTKYPFNNFTSGAQVAKHKVNVNSYDCGKSVKLEVTGKFPGGVTEKLITAGHNSGDNNHILPNYQIIGGPRAPRTGQPWIAVVALGIGSRSGFNLGHAIGVLPSSQMPLGTRMVSTEWLLKNNTGKALTLKIIFQGGFVHPDITLRPGQDAGYNIYAQEEHAKIVTVEVFEDGNKKLTIDNIVQHVQGGQARRLEINEQDGALVIKSNGAIIAQEKAGFANFLFGDF